MFLQFIRAYVYNKFNEKKSWLFLKIIGTFSGVYRK